MERLKKLNHMAMLTIGFVAGIVWIAACGGGSSAVGQAVANSIVTALSVTYDNSSSGMTATTVQAALDELKAGEYTDAEAVAAMDTKGNSNALNHDRYTNAEALAAVLAGDGSNSTLDADLLDGAQGSAYLRADQDDTSTGTVTATNFISGTKTGYITIPGSAFFLTDNDEGDEIDKSNGRLCLAEAGTFNFLSWVNIPDNVTITTMTAYYNDNTDDDGAVQVILYKFPLSSTDNIDGDASYTLADTGSLDADTAGIQSEAEAVNATCDTENNAYILKASITSTRETCNQTNDTYLRAVRIAYTYTTF